MDRTKKQTVQNYHFNKISRYIYIYMYSILKCILDNNIRSGLRIYLLFF